MANNVYCQAELMDYARNLSLHNSTITEEDFTAAVGEKFDEMVRGTYKAFQVGLTADSISGTSGIQNLWTYPAAVFFSTTVITTVGNQQRVRPL